MGLDSRFRRLLALWLLVVMLLGALAPTISRAHATLPGSSVHWLEVCTPQGMQQLAVQGDGPEYPSPVTGDHCPLCLLSHDRCAPPVAPFVWLGVPPGSSAVLIWASPRIQKSSPWAVQPRAPPARS